MTFWDTMGISRNLMLISLLGNMTITVWNLLKYANTIIFRIISLFEIEIQFLKNVQNRTLFHLTEFSNAILPLNKELYNRYTVYNVIYSEVT